MKKIKCLLILVVLFLNILSRASYADDDIYEYIYKFESISEEGEVLYDKNSPITLYGEEIKLKKNYDHNKDMFRGVWIATISNINFPKSKDMSLDDLKKDFNKILDRVKEVNLNAIFFQVSPELDAFYESKFRPWSKYLTGEQGTPPSYIKDGEDFLDYAIKETRKRGIEFHAWFNPYRVTKDPQMGKTKDEIIETLSKDNFAYLNRDLVYLFQGKLFLDPGRSEVVEFIKNTIHEFICKYDVDGIHFDDYFYPYGSQRVNGVTYKFGDLKEDNETFNINNRGIKDIKDWRRDNVNILIKEVKDIISHYNFINSKNISWGVSPFGIYAHKDDNLKNKNGEYILSSNTPKTSLSSYRDIYADTLYWVDNDLIDYVIPQIYWPFGKKEAPYEELVNFWSNALKGKRCHLYIGHGNYAIREAKGDKAFDNPYEIINQIKFNSNYDNILGSVFFNVEDIFKDIEGLGKRERIYKKYINAFEDLFKYEALIPSKSWLDFKNTKDIYDFRVLKGENERYYLFFKDKLDNDSKFYVVYGFKEGEEETLSPKNILGVYGRDKESEFQHILLKGDDIKTFILTVKDGSSIETKGTKYIFSI